jgi:hypothetical protein
VADGLRADDVTFNQLTEHFAPGGICEEALAKAVSP